MFKKKMYCVQKMRIHAPFMGYPGYYHPGSSWTLEDDGDLEGRMCVFFEHDSLVWTISEVQSYQISNVHSANKFKKKTCDIGDITQS